MENTQTNAGGGTGAGPVRDYPVIDAISMGMKSILRCFEPPAEVTQHFRNARIEVLKGVRSMIDHRIDALSRGADTGRNITVE